MTQNRTVKGPGRGKGLSPPLVALVVAPVAAAFAIGVWLFYDSGGALPSADSVSASPPAASLNTAPDHIINLICEGTIATPVNGFNNPAQVVDRTFMSGVDTKEKTGWYQGTMALSETRKGALIANGYVLTVSRPALFERYSATIVGEQFTLDRRTGAFEQSVLLSDKRRFVLIKAYCAKLIKAPF